MFNKITRSPHAEIILKTNPICWDLPTKSLILSSEIVMETITIDFVNE